MNPYDWGVITQRQYLEQLVDNYEELGAQDAEDFELVGSLRLHLRRFFDSEISEKDFNSLVRREFTKWDERTRQKFGA